MQQEQQQQQSSSQFPGKSGKSLEWTISLQKKEEFELRIILSQQYVYNTSIWIFSDKKETIVNPRVNSGRIDAFEKKYLLPGGTYIVRVVIEGRCKDNTVLLDSDKLCGLGVQGDSIDQKLEAPAMYSSALLPRFGDDSFNILYESSHEYYTDSAVNISTLSLVRMQPSLLNSGLFIFLRYPTMELYKNKYKSTPYWEKFCIADNAGKTIVQFPENCIKDDDKSFWNHTPNSGYIGLAVNMAPGMYFLKYFGKDKRTVPIYVYENWYTQFFMTVADGPLFGTIRIFLSKQMKFDPYDEVHRYIDICLAKIQNRDFTLDDQLLENVARKKYDSPMLGLLAAYIYLSGKDASENDTFKAIIKNLQEKILTNSSESPDLWALNLLSYQHFGKTINEKEKPFIDGTPMLRIAFDAIRNTARKSPWLIPENSLNDLIAENQVFDSPFNTFVPFDQLAVDFKKELPETYTEMAPASSLEDALKLSSFEVDFPKISDEINWLTPKVPLEGVGATAGSIINFTTQNKNASLYDIANNLSLPTNTVLRILKQLDKKFL